MAHAYLLGGCSEVHGTWQRLECRARQAWTRYWQRRSRAATVLILHSLDDRTLKDIGMDRSEIESVVYARDGSRRRRL
jgi:uncharacterized protein YjiS (DUF1127 family)